MVRAALSDDGPILTTERLVPVAEVKVVLARLVKRETFKLVVEALPELRVPRLVAPDTFKLVVVAPIPTTVKPPTTVVLTLVPPSWIPPKEAPVPIKMVDEPIPVPMFTVLDVPIPRESV